MNVRDVDTRKLIANIELQNIMSILGLKLGHKVKSKEELRFGKIAILSDQDFDGLHISGLILNMFEQFWPELFDMGVIHKMQTPVIIAETASEQLEFFTIEDYNKWAKQGIKHTKNYYKGLGAHPTTNFKRFLSNIDHYMYQYTLDDSGKQMLDIVFNKSRADARKQWLQHACLWNIADNIEYVN